ncbi:MAG: S26 family signal peptidase [Limisphaerales bacterium]
MKRHVHRLVCAQRDLLSPQAIDNVNSALAGLENAIRTGVKGKELKAEMGKLEATANKWLKPYPHAVWRENVEVLLVALAVAMAIRTFFLQPFKIPTGSMQPTLYGVTSMPDFGAIYNQIRQGSLEKSQVQEKLNEQMDLVKVPAGWQRVKDWLHGTSYIHIVAKNDGELEAVNPPFRILIFNITQTIIIGGVKHTIWFPPDYGEQTLVSRAALFPRSNMFPGRYYHKGDVVVNLSVNAGDHLFVIV